MSQIQTECNFEDFLKEIIQSPTPLILKVSSFGGRTDEVEISREERDKLLEQYENGDVTFQINIEKEKSILKVVSTH